VPVFVAGHIPQCERGSCLHTSQDHVTDIQSGGDVAPLNCLQVWQPHPAAADTLVVGTPFGALVPQPDAGGTYRPPVEGKVPAPAVVTQPVTEVIALVLEGGDGHIVLKGEGVSESALGRQPEIRAEAEVAGAEAALPREKVVVGVGEPRRG